MIAGRTSTAQGRPEAAFLFCGFAKSSSCHNLTPMKNALLAAVALSCLALTGCIIVIEQAPPEKPAPAKNVAAKANPDSSSK